MSTETDVTWDNRIKGFFTERDIECMKPDIKLDDHENVKKNSSRIYDVVKSGFMPQGGPRWNAEKVATFKSWMDVGCP